jgi:hypothetical protein
VTSDRALRAAAVVVTAEATVEIVLIAWRDELRVALRVALALCAALQYVFAWLLLRRSAGALLVLVLCQVTLLLVAAAGDWPAAVRVGLALTAVTASVLLAKAAGSIPSPAIPRTPRG